MVYIDVRDRKFQLIVGVPVALAALMSVLYVIDATDLEPLIPALLIGGTAVIFFLLYVLIIFVQEKMQEREAEADAESD